ncbi:hypothetical protein GW17_00007548 [Ensete ventricosum]|uniref:Uncharacterized protein n=1 Tax=Ensete ventricosum TaxID=4639 RepID=A0A444FZF4_ENSVE|nr:hypothetical protein GW17_00007548 [Ensete ventricosum]RZR73304.1 hypothetical protein BHM03_00022536 [Ensete ventricosum]
MECQKSVIPTLYRSIVTNGLAFGARHWMATLRLQCERSVFFMATNVPTRDCNEREEEGSRPKIPVNNSRYGPRDAPSAAIPAELAPYSPPATKTAVVKTCAASSSTATPPSVGLRSGEGLTANDLRSLPPRRHRQDRSTSSSTPCSQSAESKRIGIARLALCGPDSVSSRRLSFRHPTLPATTARYRPARVPRRGSRATGGISFIGDKFSPWQRCNRWP